MCQTLDKRQAISTAETQHLPLPTQRKSRHFLGHFSLSRLPAASQFGLPAVRNFSVAGGGTHLGAVLHGGAGAYPGATATAQAGVPCRHAGVIVQTAEAGGGNGGGTSVWWLL